MRQVRERTPIQHHHRTLTGRALSVATGFALIVVVACGTDPIPTGTASGLPQSSSTTLVPLDPFGIGVTGAGIRGCSAPGYREFDFWVGKWNVFVLSGLGGTSIIESELGGCAIEENWTSAFGNQGKSLNTYDATTGQWHQFWVNEGGCPFGTIFMAGTFANGSMTLQGIREQPLGFLVGPPCGPPPTTVVFKRTDLTRWTLLPSGSVIQQPAFANNDAPLPQLQDPATSGAGLRYDPVDQVTPIALVPRGSFCPTRVAARQFDFMLGSWSVHEGNENGAQGTATFITTITQCLIEERFTGPGGYEGMSYNTFDVFTQRWVRTYIDTDGQRIHMTGGLEAGKMVFTGTKRGSAERDLIVRITYDPVAPGHVEQRWDYSRDGGSTWLAGTAIRYTKN